MNTVWITGGSGGLGLAVSEAFERDGWLVISGARSFTNESAASVTPKQGTTVRLHLDVTNAESCEAFARNALQISSRVDALVCAAAILNLGSCEKTTADEYNRVMQTNFVGLARMVSLALPTMRAQGSGKIMLFSSINGLMGIPFQSAYTASKHAIEGYAECLAMETGPFGVQVCLIEPGDHRGGSKHTRLHASLEDDASPYAKAYRGACAVIERDESGGLLPADLGRKVLRNAKRRRMRFRLRVAKPDQRLAVLLHRVLPMPLLACVLRDYYKGVSDK